MGNMQKDIDTYEVISTLNILNFDECTKCRLPKCTRFVFFNVISDERGDLIAIEELSTVPFKIRRVYYLFNNKALKVRGCHAHKKLEQVLICLNGSCHIFLHDGIKSVSVNLCNKSIGLYVGNNVWREIYNFSADAVLLVIASEFYQEDDYIRNFNQFIEGFC